MGQQGVAEIHLEVGLSVEATGVVRRTEAGPLCLALDLEAARALLATVSEAVLDLGPAAAPAALVVTAVRTTQRAADLVAGGTLRRPVQGR